MKKTGLFLLLLAFAWSLAFPGGARADGIIIPEPPICDPGPCPPPQPPLSQLAVRYHHVTVQIQDQVAVTHVDQVFTNPNHWTVEGQYLFPLPQDAAVTGFKLWVDGKPVEGQVLDAKQARRRYEEIVRSQRDPALLEYSGRGAVQAQIFPIPPDGERRVELEYTQALTADQGLVRYIYPLSTEKFSNRPLESVSISVNIQSSAPLRAVYSPSHSVAITRSGDHQATAGYEASHVTPDSDFALYYSIGEAQAFHLLSYRDPTNPDDPDGFFLALIAPSPQSDAAPQPKDVLLVLDHSGSMDGAKIEQARQALVYILQHLNPSDRFNVVSFSTAVETFAAGLQPASNAGQAETWVQQIGAAGSTDINRALLEAASMVQPERPTYLIFLTDGLPTEGEIDSAKILNNFAAAAPANLRLFAFGVGYDVDTYLLDSLAQAQHGASSYVQPDQKLDEVISGFYQKISTPVLTDLSLDFGGMPVSDIYPQPLPDLFRRGQIIALGRYRAGGTANLTLRGTLNGAAQVYTFPKQIFITDSQGETGPLSALPRLWAARKIGHLLNQVRLQGATQELIDQIVRLSIRYGIVTPYTSYLVTEPSALGAAAQESIAQNQYNALQAQPAAPSSGQKAVQDSAGQGALAGAESAPVVESSAGSQVKIAGSRAFVLANGIWTDTSFDPDKMQPRRLVFLSPEYFALAQSNPAYAAALALGAQVILVIDGQAVEVVVDASVQPTQTLPPAVPTPTGPAVQPTITRLVLPTNPGPTLSATPLPGENPVFPFPCIGSVVLILFLALFIVNKRH